MKWKDWNKEDHQIASSEAETDRETLEQQTCILETWRK